MANEIDQLFAALAQAAERRLQLRIEQRAAARIARSARRRAAYARAKAAGTLPPRTRKPPACLDEPEPDPGCRCHVVNYPPCSWCENEGWDTEDTP